MRALNAISCTRRCLLSLLSASFLAAIPARAQQPSADPSAKGRFTASGPQGLFLMSRYWVATRSLERVAWYFAADGQVYARLETGITPDALAVNKGRKGTYKYDGGQFEIDWTDGKTSKRQINPGKTGDSFEWDGAIFVSAPPFSDARLAIGKYSTGLSSVGKGIGTLMSTALELRADGTFVRTAEPLVKSKGTIPTSSMIVSGGTWKADSYSITLIGKDGSTSRKLAFPYFEDNKASLPTHLFYGGVLMKRQ